MSGFSLHSYPGPTPSLFLSRTRKATAVLWECTIIRQLLERLNLAFQRSSVESRLFLSALAHLIHFGSADGQGRCIVNSLHIPQLEAQRGFPLVLQVAGELCRDGHSGLVAKAAYAHIGKITIVMAVNLPSAVFPLLTTFDWTYL